MIPDPLFELNFLNNASLWEDNVWTYELDLPSLSDGLAEQRYLVFDGIKMHAQVLLDGEPLFNSSDQFIRHVVPLPSSSSSAKLSVVFDSTIGVDGRFMACTGKFSAATSQALTPKKKPHSQRYHLHSLVATRGTGGWDWAPYTNTYEHLPGGGKGAHTFSKGIWKDVYIVAIAPGEAAISYLAPRVYYQGGYPLSPLVDGQVGRCRVWIKICRTC